MFITVLDVHPVLALIQGMVVVVPDTPFPVEASTYRKINGTDRDIILSINFLPSDFYFEKSISV